MQLVQCLILLVNATLRNTSYLNGYFCFATMLKYEKIEMDYIANTVTSGIVQSAAHFGAIFFTYKRHMCPQTLIAIGEYNSFNHSMRQHYF